MKVRKILAVGSTLVLIPGLWITQGTGAIDLSAEVIGATIMAWGMIFTFYFADKD